MPLSGLVGLVLVAWQKPNCLAKNRELFQTNRLESRAKICFSTKLYLRVSLGQDNDRHQDQSLLLFLVPNYRKAHHSFVVRGLALVLRVLVGFQISRGHHQVGDQSQWLVYTRPPGKQMPLTCGRPRKQTSNQQTELIAKLAVACQQLRSFLVVLSWSYSKAKLALIGWNQSQEPRGKTLLFVVQSVVF